MHDPCLAIPSFIFTGIYRFLNLCHVDTIPWPITARSVLRSGCSCPSKWFCEIALTSYFHVEVNEDMFQSLWLSASHCNFWALSTVLSGRCSLRRSAAAGLFLLCRLLSVSKTCSYSFCQSVRVKPLHTHWISAHWLIPSPVIWILVCLLCILISSIQQEFIGLTTFPSSVFRNWTGVVCLNNSAYSSNVAFDQLFSGCVIVLMSLTRFVGTNYCNSLSCFENCYICYSLLWFEWLPLPIWYSASDWQFYSTNICTHIRMILPFDWPIIKSFILLVLLLSIILNYSYTHTFVQWIWLYWTLHSSDWSGRQTHTFNPNTHVRTPPPVHPPSCVVACSWLEVVLIRGCLSPSGLLHPEQQDIRPLHPCRQGQSESLPSTLSHTSTSTHLLSAFTAYTTHSASTQNCATNAS